jgi:uncharacterized protein (DUF433 family)
MGLADLPASINNSQRGTEILESTPRLTPEQIREFLRRATETEQ